MDYVNGSESQIWTSLLETLLYNVESYFILLGSEKAYIFVYF